MKCIIRWKTRSFEPRRQPNLEKLDRLLAQASAAGFYRHHRVNLPERAPQSEEYLSHCLANIPSVALRDFLSQPVEFFNWGHPSPPSKTLDSPLRHTGRTALLCDGFEESDSVRTFCYHTADDLEEFEPESLAGPASRLRSLAEAALDGRFRLPSLDCAVIVFSGMKYGCLQPADRDLLWRAFHVPVFEQFRGFSHELLAWECEAHDGLHIHSGNAIFESTRGGELLVTCLECQEYALLRVGIEMTARISNAACGCGDASPRLVGMRSVDQRRLAIAVGA